MTTSTAHEAQREYDEFGFMSVDTASFCDEEKELYRADEEDLHRAEIPGLAGETEDNETYLFSTFLHSDDAEKILTDPWKTSQEEPIGMDDFIDISYEDPSSIRKFVSVNDLEGYGDKRCNTNDTFNCCIPSSNEPSNSSFSICCDHEFCQVPFVDNDAVPSTSVYSPSHREKKRFSCGAPAERTVRRRIDSTKQSSSLELAAAAAAAAQRLAISQILLALGRSPLSDGKTINDGPVAGVCSAGQTLADTADRPPPLCNAAPPPPAPATIGVSDPAWAAERERQERRRRQNREAQRRHRARTRDAAPEALVALY